MESKKCLSLDGTSPSALRRPTRSSSHRLSLRRSSTESITSVSVSVVSDGGEASSTACVTRDTSRDECALHRFIVWAAVKRNECDKMTPDEKRECPLLRCRKRFPNHELMLQHLYTCDQLAAGEYWCYDCGKVEAFSDAKCKKCFGHPSRRRKIVSMAKNFFRDLGHKSKHPALPDLEIDSEDPEAPPSYESLVERPRVELPLNEIHEIDSSELPLSTILEGIDEAEATPASASVPIQTPAMSSLPIVPLPIHPAELESSSTLNEPLIDWNILPDTVAPVNLFNPDCHAVTDRPVLQLSTTGLEQYRAQQKRRSKMLAPSSSVRSTASTNSTDSTNSTNSTNTVSTTASYNISPISAWSGPWARAAGFESTLTSPADDIVSPGGFVPSKQFAHPHKATVAQDWGTFDNEVSESYLSELPADIPMMDALPADDSLQGTLVLDPQPSFTFDNSLPTNTNLPLESDLALTDGNDIMATAPPAMAKPMVGYWTNPRSLISSAWDALQMHADASMAKLGQMSKNQFVNKLRNMSTRSLAMDGIETLVEILEGRQPTEPVKLLCFVHLIYCFSLVVHEQDAPSRWSDLFGQAMSYSTWFRRQDRQLYIQIIDALWKPVGMTEAEVISLVRAKTSPSVSRTSSLKGKKRETKSSTQSSGDSLAFVAQYFLDQFEHSVVNSINEPEIQSSDLYIQHLSDPTTMMHGDSSFADTVNFMLRHKFQRYVHVPGVATGLNDIVHRIDSNFVSTPRRLELELMHIGKLYLPSDMYFGSFIQHVRTQMDSLYSQQVPGSIARSTYYRQGAKLIETIIHPEVQLMQTDTVAKDTAPGGIAIDALDNFIKAITPCADGFGLTSFEAFDSEPPIDFASTMTDVMIDPYKLSSPQFLPTPSASTSVSGPSTTATSQSSPALATSTSTNAAKTESVNCCAICGYRPKGDPRWFGGSMAKHKKLQHAPTPPKIYQCPYPGCTSQYKNRPDNLRQHQIEKGHFVDGQDVGRRPSKRKKTEES